jgi:hypothetical protein
MNIEFPRAEETRLKTANAKLGGTHESFLGRTLPNIRAAIRFAAAEGVRHTVCRISGPLMENDIEALNTFLIGYGYNVEAVDDGLMKVEW